MSLPKDNKMDKLKNTKLEYEFKETDKVSTAEGLKSAVGKWENFDEIELEIKKIYKKRSMEKPRNVSL